MDIWHATNWFAVQTRPHQESLGASVTGKLDLDVFLPKIKQEQSVCGVTRSVIKPLFPGYFFARFCPILSLEAVRYTMGVLRVVGTRDYPLPLEPQIVRNIKERAGTDGLIPLATKGFQSGDRVAIERGPLAGWMGRVEREWDDGKRVVILLEAIQQVRMVVEKQCVSRLEIS